MRKLNFVIALVGLLLMPMLADARSTYLSQFNTRYNTSATKLNTCNLCHPNGNTSQFTSYGNAFRNNARNFLTIEPLDSDGDGFSNLTEINARTFPGVATDFPVIVPPKQLKAPDNVRVNP